MNSLDKQYTDLLQTILDYGVEKKDRTNTGTKSIFGYTIRHNMKDGFPLLTTKKMYMKGVITELLWFLRGDTNIKYLVDNDCHIWDGDAWKNYQNKALKEDFLKDGVLRYDDFINKIKTDDEFAKKWGDLGPVYGKQWRNWRHHYPKTSANPSLAFHLAQYWESEPPRGAQKSCNRRLHSLAVSVLMGTKRTYLAKGSPEEPEQWKRTRRQKKRWTHQRSTR